MISESFILTKIGDFPGSIRKRISVQFKGDGSVILDHNTAGQLPICGNTCTTDVYCVNRNDIGKIQTGNGICKSITGTTVNKTKGKHYIYFDDKNKLVQIKSNAKKIYECDFNDDLSINNCIVYDLKSHVISNSGVLTCTSLLECSLDKPDNNKRKYYLLDNKEVGTLIDIDSTAGYLYVCINNSNSVRCFLIETVGYYMLNNELYTCDKNDDGVCIKSTKSSSETCNANSSGSVIYKSNNKFAICLENGISNELSTTNEEYIINENYAVGTYGLVDNQFGILKASSYSVTLNSVTGKYLLLYFILFFLYSIFLISIIFFFILF